MLLRSSCALGAPATTVGDYLPTSLFSFVARNSASRRSTIIVNAVTKNAPAIKTVVRGGKHCTDWLITLAAAGATTGTFLDGIHTKVHLLEYDKLPVVIGGLHTSAFIPPLLALFYAAVGSAVLFADYKMGTDKATQEVNASINLSKLALSYAALAAMLSLSSYLYAGDWSTSQISLILGLCAAVNYLIFDGTKQGLAIAFVCALVAPSLELVLMNLGLWHYPHGELYPMVAGGIPRFVPMCYFFYVPALGNLSRYLWKIL